MKSITINSLIVALALGNTSFAFAKQPPGLAKPPVPAAPAALPEPPDVQEIVIVQTPDDDSLAGKEIQIAQVAGELNNLKAKLGDLAQVGQDAAKEASERAVEAYEAAVSSYPIAHMLTREGGRSKSLLIESSAVDRKEMTDMEEDLAVMTRILEKAVAREGTKKSTAKAMGIYINTDVFGSQPVQNIYLDGYGALFLMNVKFPLVAPPQKKEETKEEPATNSTWDEAKRELYGHQDTDFFPKTWQAFSQRAEEYDADKVEKLKDAVVEALKNASNIRHLKPDEFVTVTISGPSNVSGVRSVRSSRLGSTGAGSSAGGSVNFAGGHGEGHPPAYAFTTTIDSTGDNSGTDTMLTIRAKKSDADAFAKNKMTAEEFRKKASIQAYSTAGGSGAARVGARAVKGRLLAPATAPTPPAPATPAPPAPKAE